MTAARKLAEGDDPFGALPYEQMFDALATVEAMAHRQILNGDSFPIAVDEFETGLEALRRKVVSVQQAIAWSDYRKVHHVPSDVVQQMRKAFVGGWDAQAAAVSVGIRAGYPEPPEGEDQPAGDATAPETGGAETAPEPTYMELMREALVERCNKNPWCAREGEHGGECAFFASAPHPTARAQILAEVAALMATDLVPDFACPEGILAEAMKWAEMPVDRYDPPETDVAEMRANTLRSVALSLTAVERMDGTR